MQIGIKDDVDGNIIKYYDLYYDLLPTPDLNNNSRLLSPKHSMQRIGNSKEKTCRFCHKNANEASNIELVHSITLSFDNAKECTDDIELFTENGKNKIFFK